MMSFGIFVMQIMSVHNEILHIYIHEKKAIFYYATICSVSCHTSCRQIIMHEKLGHSMVNGFDIEMTVKFVPFNFS